MAKSVEKRPVKRSDKSLFFFIWVISIIGFWAVIPYVYYLGILPKNVSMLKVFILGSIQTSLLFGLVCYLSYKLLPKTDLKPFIIKNPLKRIVYPGIISGVLVGLIIFILDKFIFPNSLLSSKHPPFGIGALASIYGAINEEVLLRLFLFTFIYFLFKKVFRFSKYKRLYFLWITNVIVAIIFGFGHLPALFKIISPTTIEIFRVLLLNGIPGIVFGYLYWSKGLWTAMTAHFVTDLMVHVFLI